MKKWQIALIASLVIVGLFLADGGITYVTQLVNNLPKSQASNRPPKAAFAYRTSTRTLKYIAPTDRDLIMFLNNSTDPDGDPLTSKWYVRYNGTGDWKLLNSSRDHWGRLPVSNEKGHEIKLVVSDGMKEDSAVAILPLDPAYSPQYPAVKLGISIKGIVYNIGERSGELPPTAIEIVEDLSVIRNELGCNAVRIFGDYDDVMMSCAQSAKRLGFSVIMLNYRNHENITIEEHLERLVKLASLAEQFRKDSGNCTVILSVGNELTIDVRGICNGTTYVDRIKQIQTSAAQYRNLLHFWLRKIVNEVRKVFQGKLTYAAADWEGVRWNELDLDIVGANEYYAYEWDSEADFVKRLDSLRSFQKPVYVTETGSATYEGAGRWGGGAWTRYQNQKYSQKEQGEFIQTNCRLCSWARVDAVFLYTLISRNAARDETSYSILRFEKDNPWRRKLGFYAYQSFVVAA